jgi:hypothetical protein
MIRTCKSHDSWVHNYWIPYVSLCILLKLAIWCVVQFQEVWVQNCLVTSCHFQTSSHFRNQNTFNLQDWLALILYVGVWSTKLFLSKYLLKEASLDFKTTKRQRKYMFRSRMRCDPKTKCKMEKSITKMIDSSAPFLDQLFWPYLCFAEQLRSLVILMMFWWQNDRWHHLSQTQLDSWDYHPVSILEILATVQLKWPRNP